MKIKYRSDKKNEKIDALFRKKQNLSTNVSNERVQSRTFQLLSSNQYEKKFIEITLIMNFKKTCSILSAKISLKIIELFFSYEEEKITSAKNTKLNFLWKSSQKNDDVWQRMKNIVAQGVRKFSSNIAIKIFVFECTIKNAMLYFRGKKWISNNEKLRTKIMQIAHDFSLIEHSRKKNTLTILARDFFWSNMRQNVKRFVRNCNACERNKSWHDKKQGLLRSLSILDRIWQKLFVDFIVNLSKNDDCTNMMIVIDKLNKKHVLKSMITIKIEKIAWAFVRIVFRNHELSKTMISDKNTQFVKHVWKIVCKFLRIERKLLTAFHSQTNEVTEKINNNVKIYIKIFASYDQKNWAKLISMTKYALNDREIFSIEVNSFFLKHEYNSNFLDLNEKSRTTTRKSSRNSMIIKKIIAEKLRQAQKWA